MVHHCGDLVFSRLTKFLKSNCKLAARVSNYCGAVRVSSRVPCCLKSTSLGRSAKRNNTCLRSACRLYPPPHPTPHRPPFSSSSTRVEPSAAVVMVTCRGEEDKVKRDGGGQGLTRRPLLFLNNGLRMSCRKVRKVAVLKWSDNYTY